MAYNRLKIILKKLAMLFVNEKKNMTNDYTYSLGDL